MEVINKSRKIIGIQGEPLLPGYQMELPEGYETHPSIIKNKKKGRQRLQKAPRKVVHR